MARESKSNWMEDSADFSVEVGPIQCVLCNEFVLFSHLKPHLEICKKVVKCRFCYATKAVAPACTPHAVKCPLKWVKCGYCSSAVRLGSIRHHEKECPVLDKWANRFCYYYEKYGEKLCYQMVCGGNKFELIDMSDISWGKIDSFTTLKQAKMGKCIRRFLFEVQRQSRVV
ncbi:MAG: hypothetical protein Harvfovirus1_69 [Harvfovirus sp.]|uniref:TRAF-type domain-containing protein n=1 Tax=Harvfovirus sp. TaxID=2487768 RepID=A0A3G5A1R2_9VIRU|nr:MAG: hypothetical protein Harvfovirus1_69 [Harvfovirus sp.]